MGFLKWISRLGGPGSAARWAAGGYQTLRADHPDRSQVSDMDIFRLLINARYLRLPSPCAEAYLEGWMSNGEIGLRRLVIGILMAENRVDHLPDTFIEALDEELAKSGLPNSVLLDPPRRFSSNQLACWDRVGAV
jgi:hypothetical protein